MKAESIFDEIPAQLSKHEKKFKLSSLKKDAKMRAFAAKGLLAQNGNF